MPDESDLYLDLAAQHSGRSRQNLNIRLLLKKVDDRQKNLSGLPVLLGDNGPHIIPGLPFPARAFMGLKDLHRISGEMRQM
jgi:hypothetical protein